MFKSSIETKGVIIGVKSTIVGTFRWARTEEDVPLAFTCLMLTQADDIPIGYIGRKVKKGEIIGYINALRLDTEVLSPLDGKIVGVLIVDNLPVEYGQFLVKIEKE